MFRKKKVYLCGLINCNHPNCINVDEIGSTISKYPIKDSDETERLMRAKNKIDKEIKSHLYYN